jgi:TonB family protein
MPDWMRALVTAMMLCLPLCLTMSHGVCQDSGTQTPGYQPAAAAQPGSSLEHYLLAEDYFRQKNYQSAANEFREALNGDLQPSWVEAMSHDMLGDIFAITGQHDRALNEYRLGHLASTVGVPMLEPIQRTDPEYTAEARVAELEGTVVLSGAIGEDGFAHGLNVVQPLGLGLDEKAIEAVRQWHFQPVLNQGEPYRAAIRIPVDFRLSTHQSRWHLIRVQFDTPPGLSRPVFDSALYPIGAGLGPEAMEEGRLVAAIGRLATAKLTFEVDEHGTPIHIQVPNTSDPVWGIEATALVGQWRFTPGMKNGIAVPMPCAVELVWGGSDLDFSKLTQVYQAMDQQTAAAPGVNPGTPGLSRTEAIRIEVDAQTQAARLIIWTPPELPSAARLTRLQSTVRLRVLIGIDGRVRQADVMGGVPGLTNAAAEAVKQWVYLPTLLKRSTRGSDHRGRRGCGSITIEAAILQRNPHHVLAAREREDKTGA